MENKEEKIPEGIRETKNYMATIKEIGTDAKLQFYDNGRKEIPATHFTLYAVDSYGNTHFTFPRRLSDEEVEKLSLEGLIVSVTEISDVSGRYKPCESRKNIRTIQILNRENIGWEISAEFNQNGHMRR